MYRYWPYDEVSLEYAPSLDCVTLKTPWVGANIPVTDQNKQLLDLLIKKFKTNDLGAQDLENVNLFFSNFSKYPFCYILPSEKNINEVDLNKPSIPNIQDMSLSEFLKYIESDMDSKGIHSADFKELMTSMANIQWEWDIPAALSFSKVDTKIHPESLFSVTRRFHLIDVLSNDKGKDVFDAIKSLPSDEYKKAVGLVVRQNHYVTQKCQEALLPAIQIAGNAKGSVEDFINEEKGHDKILAIALSELSTNPEELKVSSHTIVLMYLLEFAAKKNFLSFAMIIDYFERSTYEEIDPMAKLLMNGGFEKAAKHVNHHKEINDKGEHENVGLGFLLNMPLCGQEYAFEAARIAELVSLVMNGVTKSALDLYYKNA